MSVDLMPHPRQHLQESTGKSYMSYHKTMSTGAIIVAGILLAFSDNSRATNIQENQKFAWATTTKAAKPATIWTHPRLRQLQRQT